MFGTFAETRFQRIHELTRKHENRKVLVQCSFMEVYNEARLRDVGPSREFVLGRDRSFVCTACSWDPELWVVCFRFVSQSI